MTQAMAIAFGKQRSDCARENIETLVVLIARLRASEIPGDIVECGAYRCGATIAMAAAAPDRTVWAFDLFGLDPAYAAGPDGMFAHVADGNLEEIAAATRPFPNIRLVQGRHETRIPELQTPIALLFLDSDFYDSHRVCLSHLWPQVSVGGLAVFHDPGFEEVWRALDEQGLTGRLVDVPGSPNMRMVEKWKDKV